MNLGVGGEIFFKALQLFMHISLARNLLSLEVKCQMFTSLTFIGITKGIKQRLKTVKILLVRSTSLYCSQLIELFSQHHRRSREVKVNLRSVSPWCGDYHDTSVVSLGGAMKNAGYTYWLQIYMQVLLQLNKIPKLSATEVVLRPWAKKFLRQNQLEYYKKMTVEKKPKQILSILGVYKINQQHFVFLFL